MPNFLGPEAPGRRDFGARGPGESRRPGSDPQARGVGVPARRWPWVPGSWGGAEEPSQSQRRSPGSHPDPSPAQPRTYRCRRGEDKAAAAAAVRGGAAPALRTPPPPPPRSPRPAPPIGCCSTVPRPPRPISAEQRRLETFFPGRARRGHAAEAPGRRGAWEAPAAGRWAGAGESWRCCSTLPGHPGNGFGLAGRAFQENKPASSSLRLHFPVFALSPNQKERQRFRPTEASSAPCPSYSFTSKVNLQHHYLLQRQENLVHKNLVISLALSPSSAPY